MAELTNNFTENDKRNLRNTKLHCFPEVEFAAEVNDLLIFIAVINIFLSIIALLCNTLILVALRKVTSLQPASKILYRNLAITDLCVGVIVQPVSAAYSLSEVNERWIICYYTGLISFIAAFILCLASLITVTATSVDRLLVLLLGFKYREVVTRKRANIIVVAIWVLSIVGPFSYAYVAISVSFCLFALFFSYTKIFLALRYYQIHVQSQGQSSQSIPLNIVRYRKGVYSALWVLVALIICYLPHYIAEIVTVQAGMTLSVYIARQFTIILVLLNSSLNPLLYCWKIGEVRQAAKETLRQLFSSSINS